MGECQLGELGGTPSLLIHRESAANGDNWRHLGEAEGVVQPRPRMTSGNRFGGKDWAKWERWKRVARWMREAGKV